MNKFPNWSLQIAIAAMLVITGCSKQMSTPAPDAKLNPSENAAKSTETQQAAAPFAKSSAESKPSPLPMVIPSGTAITVRLQNTVSSATSHSGDEFAATLDQPIVIDGKTIAPEGTQVTGRVIAARHSGRLAHPGYLRIALASLTLDGKTVPVQSSSVMVAGASHKRRNLAWIGGGAGGGALIGAIASGGSGALIGSAIGAAGGTGAAFATGKKDVGFGVERRLTFRLTREVSVG